MRATTDTEVNADRDTRGPPLSESTSIGKDRAPSPGRREEHGAARGAPPDSVRPPGLSRIETVAAAAAALLPEGGRVVEVGFDHARILYEVLTQRPDAHGLGVESKPGVEDMRVPPGLAARCRLVSGDGLLPIAGDGAHDIASTVVIMAGLGARTIVSLVARHPDLVRGVRGLVLCPTFLEAELRPALATLGLGLADERLAFDRGRYYEVISARRADLVPVTASDRDPMIAAWGPRLFDQRDPLLPAFLRDAKARLGAAFESDLASYRTGPKAALGRKLATLERLLTLIG